MELYSTIVEELLEMRRERVQLVRPAQVVRRMSCSIIGRRATRAGYSEVVRLKSIET